MLRHLPDALRLLAGLDQSLLPTLRELLGVVIHAEVARPRVVGVEPLGEITRREVGELKQEVRQVALGVDDDGGDAVDGRLLEQRDAQAGLARAGHADDDAVGREVAGVVHDVLVGLDGLGGEVVLAAEVEARRPVDALGWFGHGRLSSFGGGWAYYKETAICPASRFAPRRGGPPILKDREGHP